MTYNLISSLREQENGRAQVCSPFGHSLIKYVSEMTVVAPPAVLTFRWFFALPETVT